MGTMPLMSPSLQIDEVVLPRLPVCHEEALDRLLQQVPDRHEGESAPAVQVEFQGHANADQKVHALLRGGRTCCHPHASVFK
mmetsp:Transcript_14193/g.32342  ORF Transcript_14193/g.32342 Transcript_14193/m.32342 type:complete len:82 (-) Transcript_14193:741-986(-)